MKNTKNNKLNLYILITGVILLLFTMPLFLIAIGKITLIEDIKYKRQKDVVEDILQRTEEFVKKNEGKTPIAQDIITPEEMKEFNDIVITKLSDGKPDDSSTKFYNGKREKCYDTNRILKNGCRHLFVEVVDRPDRTYIYGDFISNYSSRFYQCNKEINAKWRCSIPYEKNDITAEWFTDYLNN